MAKGWAACTRAHTTPPKQVRSLPAAPALGRLAAPLPRMDCAAGPTLPRAGSADDLAGLALPPARLQWACRTSLRRWWGSRPRPLRPPHRHPLASAPTLRTPSTSAGTLGWSPSWSPTPVHAAGCASACQTAMHGESAHAAGSPGRVAPRSPSCWGLHLQPALHCVYAGATLARHARQKGSLDGSLLSTRMVSVLERHAPPLPGFPCCVPAC
jgi:hypothetical protein